MIGEFGVVKAYNRGGKICSGERQIKDMNFGSSYHVASLDTEVNGAPRVEDEGVVSGEYLFNMIKSSGPGKFFFFRDAVGGAE